MKKYQMVRVPMELWDALKRRSEEVMCKKPTDLLKDFCIAGLEGKKTAGATPLVKKEKSFKVNRINIKSKKYFMDKMTYFFINGEEGFKWIKDPQEQWDMYQAWLGTKAQYVGFDEAMAAIEACIVPLDFNITEEAMEPVEEGANLVTQLNKEYMDKKPKRRQ